MKTYLIATFVLMDGGITGWAAMAVMAICIHSAGGERKRHEVVRLHTMLENVR